MRNAHCYVTALLYLSFFLCCLFYIYIYWWVNCLPSHLIPGGSHLILSVAAPLLLDLFFLPTRSVFRLAMDCACGCLARLEPMLETCVFSEGLVLNQRQRHSALCSILYSSGIGFRAPFVHQLTDDDVSVSWVCISRIFFFMCCL